MGQFSVEICHLVGQFSMKLNKPLSHSHRALAPRAHLQNPLRARLVTLETTASSHRRAGSSKAPVQCATVVLAGRWRGLDGRCALTRATDHHPLMQTRDGRRPRAQK